VREHKTVDSYINRGEESRVAEEGASIIRMGIHGG